jgi:uncharacterized cupredoxin-like copper-binding protein
VDLDEYSVGAPADLPAGRTEFRVRNTGSIQHQLVILRTGLDPGELPVRDAEVRTHAPGVTLVKQTKRIKAGRSLEVTARLRPGSYVLICNVPGHYQSGMRTALKVP